MADISGKQICNLLTLLGAVAALILGIIILTKVNKKGWCGEGYVRTKSPILKSTYACGYIGGQTSGIYNCSLWDKQNAIDGNCITDDGRSIPCRTDDQMGPLDCCDIICGDDRSACVDPNN